MIQETTCAIIEIVNGFMLLINVSNVCTKVKNKL